MKPLRVLVVDDDKGYRQFVRDFLEMEGHTVNLLDHSDHVPEAVLVHRPDVILMDFVMPGRTGPEVIAELEALHVRVPVILVTGLPLTTDQLAGHPLLLKPFPLEGLLTALEKATKSWTG